MDYFVWNVSPEIVSIGPLTVRWYGALFATGFICGYYFMRWLYRRENKNVDELENLLLYIAAGTIIGARLGHCLFYDPGFYLSHPLKILAIWEGGLASHGGALGVLIAVYLYCRKYAVSFLWLMDRLAIPFALTAAFIRLGNVFNSEILGKATDVPWAIIFQRVDSVPRHPVQLYESLSYVLIFIITFFIYKHYGNKLKNGFLLGLTMVLLIIARFVLEFFKMPQAHYSTGLDMSVGQLLSIPYLIAGLAFIYFALRKDKKQ
ncbi:MAG: prolipoprotein diacylglyceryl transferase [Gammaproteobacteria bacterium]|jgi:prolipoprotein diacylglyceryl transferase|nr:prolipoprotein diacylglyceryl transferase [Gammaproteobacteria bacterium]